MLQKYWDSLPEAPLLPVASELPHRNTPFLLLKKPSHLAGSKMLLHNYAVANRSGLQIPFSDWCKRGGRVNDAVVVFWGGGGNRCVADQTILNLWIKPSYWTTFFLCKINFVKTSLLVTQKYISWFDLILPLFDSSLFLSNIASIICTSLCHFSFFSSTRLEWSNAWMVWRKACLAEVRLFCAKKHLACL